MWWYRCRKDDVPAHHELPSAPFRNRTWRAEKAPMNKNCHLGIMMGRCSAKYICSLKSLFQLNYGHTLYILKKKTLYLIKMITAFSFFKLSYPEGQLGWVLFPTCSCSFPPLFLSLYQSVSLSISPSLPLTPLWLSELLLQQYPIITISPSWATASHYHAALLIFLSYQLANHKPLSLMARFGVRRYSFCRSNLARESSESPDDCRSLTVSASTVSPRRTVALERSQVFHSIFRLSRLNQLHLSFKPFTHTDTASAGYPTSTLVQFWHEWMRSTIENYRQQHKVDTLCMLSCFLW